MLKVSARLNFILGEAATTSELRKTELNFSMTFFGKIFLNNSPRIES